MLNPGGEGGLRHLDVPIEMLAILIDFQDMGIQKDLLQPPSCNCFCREDQRGAVSHQGSAEDMSISMGSQRRHMTLSESFGVHYTLPTTEYRLYLSLAESGSLSCSMVPFEANKLL